MNRFFAYLALSCFSLTSSFCLPLQCATAESSNLSFALNLYKELSKGEGNLFFSPYSIEMALALAYGGAKAETAKQIADALYFRGDGQELLQHFAESQTRLNSLETDGKISLSVANSLWPDKAYQLRPDYVQSSKKRFNAEITPLDIANHTDASRNLINLWVDQATKSKIKDLIPSGGLSPATKLALVNAIYFKGKWEHAFNPQRTKDGDFHVTEGKVVPAKFMHAFEEFPYFENEALQAIDLGYQGDAVTMLLLLPKVANNLEKIEASLDTSKISEIQDGLNSVNVALSVPKFSSESSFEISQALQRLGIRDAFNPQRANFSGITDDPNGLFIGSAIHKAVVEVTEEGTEAAAATALIMRAGAAPTKNIVVRADHPFLYLIREKSSGAILFMGRLSST